MSTTRRTFLRGVAALPAASAMPAAALASALPDPTFAAIEAHRAAFAAYNAAMELTDDDTPVIDALSTADSDTMDALFQTVPTTLAGLGAMIIYLARFSDRYDSYQVGFAIPQLAEACRNLIGGDA